MGKKKIFKIPPFRYPALKNLFEFSSQQKKAIIEKLNKLEPSFYFSIELIEELAILVQIKQEEIEEFLEFIREVYSTFIGMETKIEGFIDNFRTDILSVEEELIPEDIDWSEFNSFWEDILKMDETIGVMAKATGLMIELPRLYLESRILSDVRSIFPKKVEERPKSGIIIHNLRIRYLKNRRSKEFHISLSSNDLRSLKKTIDRAIKKDQNLETTFEERGFTILNDREE